MAEAYIEILHHFHCENCNTKWYLTSSETNSKFNVVTCPNCGQEQKVIYNNNTVNNTYNKLHDKLKKQLDVLNEYYGFSFEYYNKSKKIINYLSDNTQYFSDDIDMDIEFKHEIPYLVIEAINLKITLENDSVHVLNLLNINNSYSFSYDEC